MDYFDHNFFWVVGNTVVVIWVIFGGLDNDDDVLSRRCLRNVIFFAQMLSFAWEEDIIIQLSCFLSSLRDLLNFLSTIA